MYKESPKKTKCNDSSPVKPSKKIEISFSGFECFDASPKKQKELKVGAASPSPKIDIATSRFIRNLKFYDPMLINSEYLESLPYS